jgi:hypothetical protein
VAVSAQRGVVFPDLFQGDGQVGDEDDVVVAEDHFDLGAGGVEAERLCVPKTSSRSCGQAIFVDQATDASLSPEVVLLRVDRFG